METKSNKLEGQTKHTHNNVADSIYEYLFFY